ncbi:Anthranilate synthase component 1 [Candidatus Portiera aleyrodidarum]|uniref:Anthranilate synthase component 1 n=1 Tax=Candidatus Portiera aleyrodidarum TV TaxID=1297582 RepID=A0A8D4BPN9_9GAMM|nr:anthranilate synthase component I family protein [Candidatus Portiera aleyrodidarum]AGI27215.1 anthranilate synthase, component I [Candidatus Portiera aleyrodidarum TV]CEI59203.1 Anthranilate synthase component 1 [Candidatus Portiera aleyrodidarum]
MNLLQNRILIYKDILSDIDTPLSIYMKIANYPWTFLLESIEGKKNWGRYSIIGLRCNKRIEVHGNKIKLFKDKLKIETIKIIDPLLWISKYIKQIKNNIINKSNTIFDGGLVGYFGYDIIKFIEPTIQYYKQYDPINTPDILLLIANDIIIFDKYSGRLTILVNVNIYEKQYLKKAYERIKIIENKISYKFINKSQIYESYLYNNKNKHKPKHKPIFYSFTKFSYKQSIRKIKKFIYSGDVMQCVPSQRIIIPFYSKPLNLYRSLRVLNPSPYMFYLNFNDHFVVGSSPEIMVRLDNKKITLRPIAGTRHRGKNKKEDIYLEKELLHDPKECSEHIMLIDLGRNDVGKVSIHGTVRVTKKLLIERYSHVMHIVSNIIGILKPKLDWIDVLRATFPAGTIAGAPKIRALEIINEIEPVKRGIYSGAIGYLSWNGNMNMAIAIRTAIIKNNQIHIQAGGGIIEESNYKNEWNEILNKSSVIFKAAAIVEEDIV